MYRELCSIDSDPAQTVLQGEDGGSWSDEEMNKVRVKLDPLARMTLADSPKLSPDRRHLAEGRSDGPRWRSRWKPVCRFSTRTLWNSPRRIPPGMKGSCSGRGKWLVRQVLYRYVHRKISSTGRRPALAFRSTGDGLRGPLKPWASDLLVSCGKAARAQDLFNASRVAGRKNGRTYEQRARHNHGYWLWNVLMAQAWHDEWLGREIMFDRTRAVLGATARKSGHFISAQRHVIKGSY